MAGCVRAVTTPYSESESTKMPSYLPGQSRLCKGHTDRANKVCLFDPGQYLEMYRMFATGYHRGWGGGRSGIEKLSKTIELSLNWPFLKLRK